MEQRAFRLARYATGNEDDAIEIVQEAMLGLVKRYSYKPESEWPAIFHRILQSRIRDWYRRETIRNKWKAWFGNRRDGIQNADPGELPDPNPVSPESGLERDQLGNALDVALQQLPLRQQQAFLLRTWEGMDVAGTANAMGCSAGSVKTHYSRALKALRKLLEEYRS